MKKAEFNQIFSQLENECNQLKDCDNFYELESKFITLWLENGRKVLEQMVGNASMDRRKKNSLKHSSER